MGGRGQPKIKGRIEKDGNSTICCFLKFPPFENQEESIEDYLYWFPVQHGNRKEKQVQNNIWIHEINISVNEAGLRKRKSSND